ncbi:unnamed protein product [[Candida] boidinii]|nr:unnamed protein product [[Candida] boidinii]
MVSTSDDSMMDLMDVLQEHIPSQQTDPNIARNPLNNGNNSNNNTNNNNSKATTILGNSSSSSEVTSPSSIVSPSSRSRTFSVSRSKTGSIKPTGATTTIPTTPGSHFRRRSSNGKTTEYPILIVNFNTNSDNIGIGFCIGINNIGSTTTTKS